MSDGFLTQIEAEIDLVDQLRGRAFEMFPTRPESERNALVDELVARSFEAKVKQARAVADMMPEIIRVVHADRQARKAAK